MATYIVRRILQAAVLVFIVASLVAVLIHLLPGDPAYVIVGERAEPERVAAVREGLGLDRPLWIQYLDWITNTARGDLGTSLISKLSISSELTKRLPRTLELIIVSMVISTLAGIPAGVIAAVYRNRVPDIAVSLLALVGISTPVFVSGTLLLLLFGVKLHLIPATGYVSLVEDPIAHIQRMILPAVTLALLEGAVILRMTRSSLLEVLGEDFVRTARAKGVSNRMVLLRHALRNALIPVVTIIGLQTGDLLGGTVLVEYIFNWPGLSSYLIASINQRDYPVVQAIILVIATLFVLLNLLTDVIYAVIDPRIRHGYH